MIPGVAAEGTNISIAMASNPNGFFSSFRGRLEEGVDDDVHAFIGWRDDGPAFCLASTSATDCCWNVLVVVVMQSLTTFLQDVIVDGCSGNEGTFDDITLKAGSVG